MPFYSIRPVGFSKNEYTKFEAIMTIAQGRLYDEWQCIAEGPADIYLVTVESLQEWNRHQVELPRDRLLACTLPGFEIDGARWWIQRDPEHLPSLLALARTLNLIGAELASGNLSGAPISVKPETPKPMEAISPATPANDADSFYDPDRHLIGIIRECLADGLPRRLACEDKSGAVLVEPRRGICFVPGDDVLSSPLLSAPRDQIQVHRLGDEQLARDISTMNARGRALNDLIFLAALLGSQGRLWVGCRHDEPVRLKQWLDFRNLFHHMDFIGLMAFMNSNTADVNAIAARTGISIDKVINFHNACMALDLLDRGGEVSIREKPANPEMRSLYGKIAKRLQSEV
jgi:hypothetical protein